MTLKLPLVSWKLKGLLLNGRGQCPRLGANELTDTRNAEYA